MSVALDVKEAQRGRLEGQSVGCIGEAALLSMLQSCSVISVVNIDAGFVAGAFAARVANMVAANVNNSKKSTADERK